MTDRRQKEAEADLLFGRLIRSRGICQARGFETLWYGVLPCWGRFECAHVIRRRAKSTGLRWDPDNAACLCSRHHAYFTDHPFDEERFHEQLLSPQRLGDLRWRAQDLYARPDMDEILGRLRARV